jgi:hypothetical protein
MQRLGRGKSLQKTAKWAHKKFFIGQQLATITNNLLNGEFR